MTGDEFAGLLQSVNGGVAMAQLGVPDVKRLFPGYAGGVIPIIRA